MKNHLMNKGDVFGAIEAKEFESVNSIFANDPVHKINKYEVCPIMAVTKK